MTSFRPHASPDDEDALDAALERLVRGDRQGIDGLDPEMRATVDQMYRWADESDFRDEPLPKARRGPHGNVRWLSQVSGVAAAVLLGIIVVGTFLVYDRSRGDPTPESFFGASGDDLMDALPLTPLVTPDLPPLEPTDCAAEPRTSGEALDILATPPAHGAAEPGSDASIEGVTNDELNSALRGWQACLVFGDTFGAMAYESDQYLREHLYPTSHMSELPAGVTPDVFLSNRISADTIRAALFQANPEPASYIVDTSVPPTSSQTWDWVQVNIVLVWPETNERQNPSIEATFIMEDGDLRIRSIDDNIFNVNCANIERSGQQTPCYPASPPAVAD
jgi:hypothetical protein